MKSGIALIELIIAIVVMAIVFMAVPPIMDMSMKSSETSIQQEAVALASTQMDVIASLQWDEQNTNNQGYAKILDTSDNSMAPSTFGYGRYPDDNSTYRIGTKTINANKGQYRRKFENHITFASTTLKSEEGTDSTNFDDIDDYNGFIYSLNESDKNISYKFDYNVSINVKYIKNNITYSGLPTGSSNIKLVTVQVYNGNDTNISIKAFFCNIGETKILIKPIE